MGFVDNVVHLMAPLTANCRGFQQRWDAATALGPDGISGGWTGEWISAVSGHRGGLRCVIDPVAPALWRMHFKGEYSRVFRACYSTDFTVVQEAGRWTFSGSTDLGALAGGKYTYDGHATLKELICSYRSARDRGEFRMKRYSGG